MNKILVIAAHPDDETYGLGGTIVKHVRSGDQVNVIIVSDGVTSHHPHKEQQKEAAN